MKIPNLNKLGVYFSGSQSPPTLYFEQPFNASFLPDIAPILPLNVVLRPLTNKNRKQIERQSNLEIQSNSDLISDDTLLNLNDSKSLQPIARALSEIIQEAIEYQSSDVHLCLDGANGKIFMRIDGLLQLRHTVPRMLLIKLIARIKMVSGLDLSQTRLPQDGRMQATVDNEKHDIRLSCIPTLSGERIAMRVLARTSIPKLTTLGLEIKQIELLRKLGNQASGLILISGPTGSGKTTTLYSLIQEIKDSKRNIISIEDPVEYQLQGISQTQVNHDLNYTFAKGLRSILRQDPDVILIGEIRDAETASIAVAAGMTGHLVISTIHATNLKETIYRFMALKVSPVLLSSSLLGLVEQRLIRKLCNDCLFYRRARCKACSATGYYERIGIYNLTEISPEDRQTLCHSHNHDANTVFSWEKDKKSLLLQANQLISSQITNEEEVRRVLTIPV